LAITRFLPTLRDYRENNIGKLLIIII